MSSSIFTDRRAAGLLNRVRDDVSRLRDDIGSLLTHAKQETLPHGARELADQAKQQFAAGSAYAASRLRGLRSQPTHQSAGWVGGAVVAGLLAYGVYALCRNGCCTRTTEGEAEEEIDV
ncbi:MAG: hypothetical protein V4819_12715 [Verrucomicrobiota bacterium]